MALVPKNEFNQSDLAKWFKMSAELKKLKVAEMLLRKSLFNVAFPEPKEGTNNFALPDGYILKGKHTLTRNVDPGAFDAMKDKMRENGINPDIVVVHKPSLVTSEFKKLTEDQHMIFDQCLIIKDGSPALDIVLPAKEKARLKAEAEAKANA